MSTTGLGQPEVVGKKSLFQPPSATAIAEKVVPKNNPPKAEEPTSRLRITTDLTKEAMETIQSLQHQYRLRTGKSLPAWKIVSEALELYGKEKNKNISRSASSSK